MGFGLVFTNTSAGTLNTMMRYWEMRAEIKKLTKEEAAVVRDDAKIRSMISRHNVEKAKEALEALDKDSREALVAAYKLIQNDFLSLKVLTRLILETERVLHEEVKQLREAERNKLLTPAEVKVQLKQLEQDEAEIGHLSVSRIFDLLNRARLASNGVIHLLEGKMDSAFFIKEHFFLDSRFMNYFVMRYEASNLRRSISHVNGGENVLERHAKAIKQLTTVKKDKKKEASELAVEQKDVHKLLGALKDAFIDVYKLFVKTMLMFEKMIKIVINEEFGVKIWVKGYEIPASLGEDQKRKLESLLEYAKGILRTINYDINQLDSLRVQIGREAA